jgi:mannose-6-phosphate isomerase
VIIEPVLIREGSASQEYQLISYEHTARFAMNKIVCKGVFDVPDFAGHRIAIVTKGFGEMIYPEGKKKVCQGQGVFLPAGLQELQVSSVDGMEIIIAFPPRIN